MVMSLILAVTSFSQPNYYLLHVEKADGNAVLSLRTFDFLPCFGYSIRVTQMWEGDTAVVSVLGFVKPNPCIGGASPAEIRVLVEHKDKEDFFLKIIDSGAADVWRIEFANNAFTGTPIKNSFTTYH